jgi:hypothetical protein
VKIATFAKPETVGSNCKTDKEQMIKRIFDLVTFPFYLIYRLISFPFKIAKIIIDDKIEKRRNSESKALIKTSDKELIEIGPFLFSELSNDYTTFIRSYLTDKKTFLNENKKLLEEYDNFEMEKLKPIEVIYIFGDSKGKLWMTDWRGEENETEIEQFFEDKLQIKTDWKNVTDIRKGLEEEKQRDGKFIIDLLNTFDKDLETLNKRLIFLNLGWDAYVYTVIDQVSYKTITDKFGTLFHGTEKLRK